MSASKHSSAPNDCPQWVVGSTGGRNTSIFDEMGVEAMKRRQRIYYTAAQRSEIWDRWQRGESMSSNGRGFDRESSSIFSVLSPSGGIRPAERRRSGRALRAEERRVGKGWVGEVDSRWSPDHEHKKQTRK